MAGSEEQVAERIRQFVAAAADAPWVFSADDARQAARRRPLLVAVAHRAVTTVVATAVVVSIVAVLFIAGVFSAGPSIAPARTQPDGVVEGFFRAVGGPAPCISHTTNCYPGYENL